MNISDLILSYKSSWEKLTEDKNPIVIYGTGNGADVVIDELEKLGVSPSAVCASNGFVRKRKFRNFDVISIEEAKSTFSNPTFALSFASSLPDVMQDIINLSKNSSFLVPVVPVFGSNIINRQFITENSQSINKAYSLLYDEKSKEDFKNIMLFQFTGELSYLLKAESSREEALKDLLKLTDREFYADLGAYRGDTLEELSKICGGFSEAIALEPDKKTFAKLTENTKEMKNLTLVQGAAYSQNTTLIFSGGGGRQSALSESGYEVQAYTLESLAKDRKITYIKADVEGAEKEALEGMKEILKTQKPKLCISAYHRSEDIFSLVLQIHTLNPEYKIHLRHHPYIPAWETNLYCT